MTRGEQVIIASYDAEAEEIDAELQRAIPMLHAARLPPFRDRVVKTFAVPPNIVADQPDEGNDLEEEPPRNFVRVRGPL